MSFGWSASDVVAALHFLNNIRLALKESGGAAERYQEDNLYLNNVSSTLTKVTTSIGNGPLKDALSQRVGEIVLQIKGVNVRLERYKASLSPSSPRSGLKSFFLRGSNKVQYALFTSKEVRELRNRIAEGLLCIQLELGLSSLVTASQIGTHISSLSAELSSSTSLLGAKLDQQTSRLSAASKGDLHRNILAWLNPVMRFEDKYRTSLEDNLEGSCDWILSKQAYMDWYRGVTASLPAFLWVTAIPGAGKTTVASRVIERLKQSHLVAYFYCETRVERSRNTIHILTTLAWQILQHDADLLEYLEDVYSLGAEPNIGRMKAVLYKLVQAKSDILIVLDGLDECTTVTQQQMCDFLAELAEMVSVLVFSRDVIEINDGLMKKNTIPRLLRLEMIEPDTKIEIEQFIFRELRHLPEIDDESTRKISESLQKRAQGMFLWVDLMIKQFSRGWFDVEDCLQAIEQTPNDLNQLYSHIMQKIYDEASEQERQQSKTILSWLACAQRPLKVLELVIGSKMQHRLEEPKMHGTSAFPSSQLKRVINRRCGPLVRFIEDKHETIVILVHATTKDFLLNFSTCSESFTELLVDPIAAHALISRSCLTYISYDEIRFCPFNAAWTSTVGLCAKDHSAWKELDTKTEAHIKSYPLLEYAVVHWADHFSLSNWDHKILQNLRWFCSSETRIIKWLQIFLRLQGDKGVWRSSPAKTYFNLLESFVKRLPSSIPEFERLLCHLSGASNARFQRWERFVGSGDANDFLLPLHIAAFFDFHSFVRQELQQGVDVNQQTVSGQTPLHLAARGDSLASGELLIHHGANINAIGWVCTSPLSWAVDVEDYRHGIKPGPFLMAEELVSRGADTAIMGSACSPLSRACGMPTPSNNPFLLKLIRSLLEKAPLEAVNGCYGHISPLVNAAAAGARETVRLLLEYKVCPNGGSGGLHNPLLSTLRGPQDREILLLLLRAGANPNIVDRYGRPVLHVCIKECKNSLVLAELLLDFGVDVNGRASDNSLAVHEAVVENKLDDIELLIRYGTSLNAEDAMGRTPLMIANQQDHQDAVRLLLSAGATTSGSDWQPRSDNNTSLESRCYTPIYEPQNPSHLREMYWIMRYRGWRARPAEQILSRQLTLRILKEARYWLRATSSDTRDEVYDQQRASLNEPYLSSAPLSGAYQCCVEEIVISIHSHDQGWSDYKEHHGTHECSFTWFDIVVQRANDEWLDIEDALICRNIHASNKSRMQCIVFGKEPPAIPCQWIGQLKPGDRVGVVPKAEFPGWVNYVQGITIEVFSACLDSKMTELCQGRF